MDIGRFRSMIPSFIFNMPNRSLMGIIIAISPAIPPTTGATSWLYVHLLAIPAFFGISDKGLLTVAAVMNLVFLWLCLYFLGRLGEKLYAPEVGFASVLFCLSSGAFLWGRSSARWKSPFSHFC